MSKFILLTILSALSLSNSPSFAENLQHQYQQQEESRTEQAQNLITQCDTIKSKSQFRGTKYSSFYYIDKGGVITHVDYHNAEFLGRPCKVTTLGVLNHSRECGYIGTYKLCDRVQYSVEGDELVNYRTINSNITRTHFATRI